MYVSFSNILRYRSCFVFWEFIYLLYLTRVLHLGEGFLVLHKYFQFLNNELLFLIKKKKFTSGKTQKFISRGQKKVRLLYVA